MLLNNPLFTHLIGVWFVIVVVFVVKLCPRCGSIMYPLRKKEGGEVVLKCSKCGYEIKGGEDRKYSVKYYVEPSKRTSTTTVSEARESKLTPEEREMLKEYYEIFLEEFARSEVEESSEE